MQNQNTHKVLVADESLSCQLLMRVLMKKASLDATIVGTGPALIAAAASKRFDIIFINTTLPEISGVDAADMIRKSGIKTPMIAILSGEEYVDLKKCLKVSFDGYLQKPITKKPLFEVIAKFLSSGVRQPEASEREASEYIERFLNDIPGVLEEIEELNRNIDLEMIAELVDELKDTGSIAGLESMQDYAEELEVLLSKVNMDSAHEAIDEIYSICLRLINKQNT